MVTTQWSDARIEAGDEVMVPAFGGLEDAERVRALGAVPVPVDIDSRTFCIRPEAVRAALTGRTAAVVARDLFGHPADIAALDRVTRQRGVQLVHVGPAGGAGSGPVSLDVAARRRHAAYLDSRLTGVVVPAVAPGARHSYREYVVRVPGNGRPDRDAFQRALRERGVPCHVPVKAPVHRTPGFRVDVRLPEAERASDECLSLPVEASLTKRELQRVVSACNALGGLLLESVC